MGEGPSAGHIYYMFVELRLILYYIYYISEEVRNVIRNVIIIIIYLYRGLCGGVMIICFFLYIGNK